MSRSKMCTKLFRKSNIGLVIASVGVGVLIAVLVPFWGWLLVGGAALVYVGWWIYDHM